MANALPPIKGTSFSFELALVSQSDTDIFQAAPTLANGDVIVIKDGTLDGNIDALPTAVTSCTNVITVTLSNDEMNADRVTVLFHDDSGDEWQDVLVNIRTSAQTLDTIDANVDSILADTGTTLNDKIDTIDGNVDSILADTGTDGVVLKAAGLNADAVDEILDEVVEGTYTVRHLLRLMAAALFGKVSGGGTTEVTFRDTGDTTDRIVATVDADGNRSAVTLTET